MDYSILNRQLEKIDNKYPWSLPVPPIALEVGKGSVLTLLGGKVFTIKLYRVGTTIREAKGIAKTVTTQPLSCFRSILRQSPQDKITGTKATSQVDPDDVGTKTPQREELDLHPIRMRDILQTVHKMREQASSTGNTWTGKPDDKDQGSTAATPPEYQSWRHLESPTKTPVC